MLRILALTLALGLAIPAPALALTVSTAKVAQGAVQVKGAKAAPLALIFWEGTPVAQATRSGSFRFQTAILPGDWRLRRRARRRCRHRARRDSVLRAAGTGGAAG